MRFLTVIVIIFPFIAAPSYALIDKNNDAHLRIEFEENSSRLLTGQNSKIERWLSINKLHITDKILIVKPRALDSGQTHFLTARLASLTKEIAPYGYQWQQVDGEDFIDYDNKITLLIDRSSGQDRPFLSSNKEIPEDIRSKISPKEKNYRSSEGSIKTELSGWQLIGAIPGQAWVRSPLSKSYEIDTIKIGDSHPLLGTIEKIDFDPLQKRWFVMTSAGKFEEKIQ
jgi:hypothetical protein